MIIFNDSISKFTSAAFEIFAEAYLFFSICLGKKKPRIKFLGILKNTSPKINFCLKKKSNVSNISNIFKLDFVMQIIYSFIHRCLYSLFMFFCSLISVSKQNIEKMLTLPYSYYWQKLNKMNEKRSQEYQSIDTLNM